MAKVTMKDVRTIAEFEKEPANVPTGVWEFRAISLKVKDVTKKTKEGEEYETEEFTLALEPLTPTASVNPDELAEIDEQTGKPVYEGKRVFARFVASFFTDKKQFAQAMRALGVGDQDDLNAIIEKNSLRGRKVMGELFNRTYPRNDGTQGTEQKVRNWCPVGSSPSGLSI